MKLLLDEMLSPQIARDLRAKQHDVQAVKRDRPELQGLSDEEIVRRSTDEQRAVVTNNVRDFLPIHQSLLAGGEVHYGMLFSLDETMPRGRSDIPRWVATLEGFLRQHAGRDALRNRVHFLP